MKIYVGADHAGFGLKEVLVPYLKELGYEVEDKGTHEYDEQDDFTDFIIPVAKEVSQRPNDVKGIILGGSGQGEAMAANKLNNVRAAVYYGKAVSVVADMRDTIVKVTREHNDSNILSLGARFITEEDMKEAVKEWLQTPFTNEEKRVRRNKKMDQVHD